MSQKIMLINATVPEEIRVATLADGHLLDFDVEFTHNEKIKGNIYKAKIVRVDQSLQAAFIHYGSQKNGFLPLGELPRDMVSADGRRGRIQDLLARDQEIMVQAVREELGSKGAMMTAQASLPGRYLVLTPGNAMNGISRKIESREEREYFKQLIDELDIPKNMGVIVRTASMGVTKEDFQRDLEFLLDTWKEVQTRYKHRQGPGLVWQEDDVVTRTLRDGFTKDISEVHIDDLDTFHQAEHFFRRTMPQFLPVLHHYTGKKPLFSKFQTEEQIDRIYGRKVSLPGGGALVLDQTEALVAIDVNSGKTTGDNQEDTAQKTNLEAAEEVARQLRLRDLAGLIVIDFIDMKREGNIRAVQDKLVECLKEDKARMEVGKINRFGVLVMTRQRLRPSIQQVSHESCPNCQGTGQVKSLEALVLSVVRRLKSIVSKEGIAEVRVKLAPGVAAAVQNQKRREIAEMEELYGARIVIHGNYDTAYGEMVAEIERSEDEPKELPAPRSARERQANPEDETVVLGGDSPISFEKALGTAEAKVGDFKYDRRDAQQAALEERNRLRALFESAMPEHEAEAHRLKGSPVGASARKAGVRPEDELAAEGAAADSDDSAEGEDAPGTKKRRRRRRGGKGQAASAPEAAEGEKAQETAPAPAAQAAPKAAPKAVPPASAPEPPKLTADLMASILSPMTRPKKLSAATPTPEPEPVPTAKKSAAKPKAAPAKKALKKDKPEPKAETPVKATAKRKAPAAPAAPEAAPAPRPKQERKPIVREAKGLEGEGSTMEPAKKKRGRPRKVVDQVR